MPTNNQSSGQRTGESQATDPATGRDEDDHIITPPRTASVYEEEADGMSEQPQQPYDEQSDQEKSSPKKRK